MSWASAGSAWSAADCRRGGLASSPFAASTATYNVLAAEQFNSLPLGLSTANSAFLYLVEHLTITLSQYLVSIINVS